jgi:hypothetical protein
MLWQTTVITLADPAAADPAATARIGRALGNASTDSVGTDGAIDGWVRPSLPGTVRGGHLIRRLGFPDEAAWRRWLGSPADERSATVLDGAEVLAHTTATYDDGRVGARQLAGVNPVYRALLLRAEPPGLLSSVTGALPEPPGTPAGPDVLERFEDELFAMGEAIPVMRQWRLARVIATGGSAGSVPWTHVWEQVFPGPEALHGAYMRHPYHWALVDRWFDGESPDRIVTADFCHTFCALGP